MKVSALTCKGPLGRAHMQTKSTKHTGLTPLHKAMRETYLCSNKGTEFCNKILKPTGLQTREHAKRHCKSKTRHTCRLGMSWPPKMGAVASKLAERVYKTTPVPAPRAHRIRYSPLEPLTRVASANPHPFRGHTISSPLQCSRLISRQTYPIPFKVVCKLIPKFQQAF